MSEHPRKVIREKVLALLKHHTSVGEEVYANRAKTLFANHEPTILIYTLNEASTQTTIAPEKKYTRKLNLAVEVRALATASENLDDYFDGVAREVENIFNANPRLLDSCAATVLTATRFDFSPSGQKLMGAMRLDFEVTYFSRGGV